MNDQTVLSGAAEADDTATAFDWRACWYPATFVHDLPRDRPTPVALYDTGLVLFFDGDGQVHCLRDLCPHRAARPVDIAAMLRQIPMVESVLFCEERDARRA